MYTSLLQMLYCLCRYTLHLVMLYWMYTSLLQMLYCMYTSLLEMLHCMYTFLLEILYCVYTSLLNMLYRNVHFSVAHAFLYTTLLQMLYCAYYSIRKCSLPPFVADAVHQAVHCDGDPLDGGMLAVPHAEKPPRGRCPGSLLNCTHLCENRSSFDWLFNKSQNIAEKPVLL